MEGYALKKRYIWLNFILAVVVLAGMAAPSLAKYKGEQTFTITVIWEPVVYVFEATEAGWSVPEAGIYYIAATGGRGGSQYDGHESGEGGAGATKEGYFILTASDVLNIQVGTHGSDGQGQYTGNAAGGTGQWFGSGGKGGKGGASGGYDGGGGGAASGVLKNGTATGNIILAAAGGGGGGGSVSSSNDHGMSGDAGAEGVSHREYTNTSGNGQDGGNGGTRAGGGGGGGGGYTRGGTRGPGGSAYTEPWSDSKTSSRGGGGGGGSSYIATSNVNSPERSFTAPGNPNNNGDGYVVVIYLGEV